MRVRRRLQNTVEFHLLMKHKYMLRQLWTFMTDIVTNLEEARTRKREA
jgi:replicative DNA helicase